MRPPYSDHPEEGRRHATVDVAMSRVLDLVRSAGIPGFVENDRFDDDIKRGSVHYKWHQGWNTTEDYEVTMRVEVDLTSPKADLDAALVPMAIRMQWPSDGRGDLATRTAMLDLMCAVNRLSARLLSEMRGLFILDEGRHDEWRKCKAEEEAQEEQKQKVARETEAEKKRGRRRRK